MGFRVRLLRNIYLFRVRERDVKESYVRSDKGYILRGMQNN
jgi:hypothetical protein